MYMCHDDKDDDKDDDNDDDDDDNDGDYDDDDDDDRSRAIWRKMGTIKKGEWYKRVIKLSIFKVHDILELKCHFEDNHFV